MNTKLNELWEKANEIREGKDNGMTYEDIRKQLDQLKTEGSKHDEHISIRKSVIADLNNRAEDLYIKLLNAHHTLELISVTIGEHYKPGDWFMNRLDSSLIILCDSIQETLEQSDDLYDRLFTISSAANRKRCHVRNTENTNTISGNPS